MIFQTFAVNNFGIYRGNQQFDLSPQSKKHVILIGALNGSGKTTFLHAIDFCLYGKQSNFSGIIPKENLAVLQPSGIPHCVTPISIDADVRISLQMFISDNRNTL